MKFLLVSALLLSLGGCTLSTEEVEPALPKTPVFNNNAVVYQLNGLPVVAHNYSSVLSAIFGGGLFLPVDVFFRSDSTLIFRAADEQNEPRPGGVTHALKWELRRFRGVGRYQPVPTETTFQLLTRGPTGSSVLAPLQRLNPLLPAEVVVTGWDPQTQRAQGTFELNFAAQGVAPAAALRQGSFDVKPSF